MYNTTLLRVILVAVVSVTSGAIDLRTLVQQDNLLKHKPLGPNEGHFNNCGIAKNFSMVWTPKDLKPRGVATITISLIVPYDWANGKVSTEVYMEDLPDTPILEYDAEVTCDELKKLTPVVKCPYKAQDLIQLSYTDNKLPALPIGQYMVSLKLKNSKDQEVICGKADVNITD